MNSLDVWNENFLVAVFPDGRLNFQLMVEGRPTGVYLGEAYSLAEVTDSTLFGEFAVGIARYPLPAGYERVIVRREGEPQPALTQEMGDLPPEITAVDEEMEFYPCLHILRERRTALPWRLEQWYTLVGQYLVYDSNQYFEKGAVPGQFARGERIIAELRQVLDVVRLANGQSAAHKNPSQAR
ncbi:MAG: hypothetical protein H5T64_00145 [Chloroflexi bacterium]|nr:hypothetical protein [Chloroflexota bacterium]